MTGDHGSGGGICGRRSVGAQQAGLAMIASGEVPVNDLITVRLPVERVHDAIDTVAKGAAIKVTIEP